MINRKNLFAPSGALPFCCFVFFFLFFYFFVALYVKDTISISILTTQNVNTFRIKSRLTTSIEIDTKCPLITDTQRDGKTFEYLRLLAALCELLTIKTSYICP